MLDQSLIGILFRSVLGTWGYSGCNTPPRFGDFEAQRHWMEITTSVPIQNWYRQSPDNDLDYWGLDYPPLTAYVSWIFGKFAQLIYPPLVELENSRGHESDFGKIFMRSSVIICDILILFPALVVITTVLKKLLNCNRIQSHKEYSSQISFFLYQTLCFCCPSLLLIDHGHFQYNGVCIGLALLALVAVHCDYDVLGSVLFCLSLNFKQMALYYSPVFFFCLLRKCMDKTTFYLKLLHLVRVGCTVILSFVLLWSPFCIYHHEDETCLSSLLLVLKRIFPFSRGIFEDKVANLWYTLSVLFDYRNYVESPQNLVPYSLYLTLLMILPVGWSLLQNSHASHRGGDEESAKRGNDGSAFLLTLSLVVSSLAFFLASFQVHEKSLLLSLVPALLLLPVDTHSSVWFQTLGAHTMFPLLVRDGLRIPYYALAVMFITTTYLGHYYGNRFTGNTGNSSDNDKTDSNEDSMRTRRNYSGENNISGKLCDFLTRQCKLPFLTLSYSGMFLLHLLEMTVVPPARYPDLHAALFSIFGAVNLSVAYAVGVLMLICHTSQLNDVVELNSTSLNRLKTD